MSNHWDNYWSEGHLTSFCGEFSNNYEDDFYSFWAKIISEISVSEANVLDIACGNLALSIVGLEVNSAHNYHALDSSKIDKTRLIDKKPELEDVINKIIVQDETLMEKTPYQDETFDLITSMYGFEYSDISKTISELQRVLKANGEFVSISHDENSVILERNKATLACHQELIHREKVFDALLDLSKSIGNISFSNDLINLNKNKKVNRLKKIFNARIAAVDKKYPSNIKATGVLTFIQKLFQNLMGTNVLDRKAAILAKRKELIEQSKRLEELTLAAFTNQKEKILYDAAKQNNLEILMSEPFYRKNDFVGRVIKIKKN